MNTDTKEQREAINACLVKVEAAARANFGNETNQAKRFRSDLRKIKAYEKNVESAHTRLSSSEPLEKTYEGVSFLYDISAAKSNRMQHIQRCASLAKYIPEVIASLQNK